MVKDWKEELDFEIRTSLQTLIDETKEYDDSIKKSKDQSKAQIWVALALINNKINNLNPKKEKIPKKELDKILKTIESL